MAKLSLKLKLAGIIGVLIAILIAVGGVGYSSMTDVVEKFEHVVKINMGNATSLSNMETSVYAIRGNLYRIAFLFEQTAEREAQVKLNESRIETFEKAQKIYLDVPFVEGEDELYKPVGQAWDELKTLTIKLNDLAKKGGVDSEKLYLAEVPNVGRVMENFRGAIDALQNFQDTQAAEWSKKAFETSKRGTLVSAIMVLAGALVASILGFVFVKMLIQSLSKVSDNIKGTADQVAAASQELAASSQMVSSGTVESAASLEETVASVEEISAMTKKNAENASEAAKLSVKCSESASEGEIEMKRLVESIGGITDSSKKIEEIINVIDDIAFQTNLLALNAAVEAARAGEQGKGFAVVAEAVRGLALKSAEAAKDISGLIQGSVEQIHQGSKMADRSEKVLKNIVEEVKKISHLNGEIATGSQEQAEGIAQITVAMNQMDQSTQQNASAAEEVSASSEEMNQQATILKDLVGDLNKVIYGAA